MLNSLIPILLVVSVSSHSLPPTAKTLVKRELDTRVSVPTILSFDKVVIETFQHIQPDGEDDILSIVGFDPHKFQLLSKCSMSYEHEDNKLPFVSKQVLFNVGGSFLNPGDMIYKLKFGNKKTPASKDGIDATLCVKTPSPRNPTFTSMLSQVEKKSISFWFDLTVTEKKVKSKANTPTGMVTFGEPVKKQFVAGTEQSFPLKPSTSNPAGWITNDLVTITIESKSGGARRNVQFDIGSPMTLLPVEMYNALFGPNLKASLDVLGDVKVPKDVSKLIGDYSGSPIPQFKCDQADEILGFKLNNLVVPNTHLYDQLDRNTCILRVAPQPSSEKRDLVLGLHVIRQFHMQIVFGNEPIAILSQKTGKKASSKTSCLSCFGNRK